VSLSRWRRPDDRGAVGVTFAILLASGVLLGALALVVDVGRIYVERGELQNGADSAALAIARACAEDLPECGSKDAIEALAARYANLNAQDGHSAVDSVCGEVPGGLLPACGAQPANLTGCLGEAPPDQYVEVHLSTLLGDGSTVLPPAFAQTLSGADAGTTVGACARAAWGPADLTILAITISTCEFQEDTLHGYANAGSLRSTDERVIQFWTGAHHSCGLGPDAPGPAGFLEGGGANCRISMTADGWVGADTSARFVSFEPYKRAPLACEQAIEQARADRALIYLPVHDRIGGGGTSFHHVEVAPFMVTGYQFGCPRSCGMVSDDRGPYNAVDYLERSYLTHADPCGNPYYRCLAGAFVGEPIPVEALTGDNRIRLVG
jgi:hypothetical protein